MTLPRSRYAGIPYEMVSSASGTMLRMVCRSCCRVVRLGSSRFAKYSSTSCFDMRSILRQRKQNPFQKLSSSYELHLSVELNAWLWTIPGAGHNIAGIEALDRSAVSCRLGRGCGPLFGAVVIGDSRRDRSVA